jgi:hypothetical protein
MNSPVRWGLDECAYVFATPKSFKRLVLGLSAMGVTAVEANDGQLEAMGFVE